jgi:hypothetical protein
MYRSLYSGRLLGQVLSVGVCSQFSVSYSVSVYERELRVGWFYVSYGELPF